MALLELMRSHYLRRQELVQNALGQYFEYGGATRHAVIKKSHYRCFQILEQLLILGEVVHSNILRKI